MSAYRVPVRPKVAEFAANIVAHGDAYVNKSEPFFQVARGSARTGQVSLIRVWETKRHSMSSVILGPCDTFSTESLELQGILSGPTLLASSQFLGTIPWLQTTLWTSSRRVPRSRFGHVLYSIHVTMSFWIALNRLNFFAKDCALIIAQ